MVGAGLGSPPVRVVLLVDLRKSGYKPLRVWREEGKRGVADYPPPLPCRLPVGAKLPILHAAFPRQWGKGGWGADAVEECGAATPHADSLQCARRKIKAHWPMPWYPRTGDVLNPHDRGHRAQIDKHAVDALGGGLLRPRMAARESAFTARKLEVNIDKPAR